MPPQSAPPAHKSRLARHAHPTSVFTLVGPLPPVVPLQQSGAALYKSSGFGPTTAFSRRVSSSARFLFRRTRPGDENRHFQRAKRPPPPPPPQSRRLREIRLWTFTPVALKFRVRQKRTRRTMRERESIFAGRDIYADSRGTGISGRNFLRPRALSKNLHCPCMLSSRGVRRGDALAGTKMVLARIARVRLEARFGRHRVRKRLRGCIAVTR